MVRPWRSNQGPSRLSDDVQVIYAVVGDRLLGLKYATSPTPEPLRLIRNWRSLLDE